MNNGIYLLSGPDITYNRISSSELNQFTTIGDGRKFIQLTDVNQCENMKSCIIFAHGTIFNKKREMDLNLPEITAMDLIENKPITVENIFLLQEKLHIDHFYLFSCHGGTLPYSLWRFKEKLSARTRVTVFSSGKYTMLSSYAEAMIRKISSFYVAHRDELVAEIDREFFLENGLFSPWTVVRCEITEQEGERKCSAFKVRSPKGVEDIHDLTNYIHEGRSLRAIILEDDGVLQGVFQEVKRKMGGIKLQEYKDCALIDASHRGKLARVKAWVEIGAKINPSWVDCSALHSACIDGHTMIVRWLIDQGADIHQQTDEGTVALYTASQYGRTDIVKMLIEAGALIDHVTKGGFTPLCVAAQEGHAEVVQGLIDGGAMVNHRGGDGATALYLACQNGRIKIVQMLIRAKASIDEGSERMGTPLHVASQNGHAEVVKLLLKEGASVDCKRDDGATALYLASQNGHATVVQLLIQARATIDLPFNQGYRPLHIASSEGQKEVVRLLIAAGATIDSPLNNTGYTALHLASDKGDQEIVAMLIQARASIDHLSKEEFTPLCAAAQAGATEVVELLIKEGALINHRGRSGATPLYFASQNGHKETVRLLIAAGATMDSPLDDGRTPLDAALNSGHQEIVAMLTVDPSLEKERASKRLKIKTIL